MPQIGRKNMGFIAKTNLNLGYSWHPDMGAIKNLIEFLWLRRVSPRLSGG